MTRRQFMAAQAAPLLAAPSRLPIKKAVLLSMLPPDRSYAHVNEVRAFKG